MKVTVTLPAYIAPETWAAFCEMRRMKGSRAPLTQFAADRIVAKLAAFHAQGYDAEFILGEAIERGWTSVFLTPDTPKRSLEAEKSQQYLAEMDAHKASRPAEEVKARLAQVVAGLRRVA